MDRGFGNARFAQLCEDNGFDFVLRTKDNLRVKIGDQIFEELLSAFSGSDIKFVETVSQTLSQSWDVFLKNYVKLTGRGEVR